jgi:hypothetical protein
VGPLGGCSPCLCQLRTDGLAPASKYGMYRSHARDMGSVSLVLIDAWISPLCSLRVGEKLDGDP